MLFMQRCLKGRFHEKLMPWMFIGALLPLLYVASFGPACWITSWCDFGGGWILVIYRPIIFIAETYPVLDYFAWYSLAGAAKGWGWTIDVDGHFVDWARIH